MKISVFSLLILLLGSFVRGTRDFETVEEGGWSDWSTFEPDSFATNHANNGNGNVGTNNGNNNGNDANNNNGNNNGNGNVGNNNGNGNGNGNVVGGGNNNGNGNVGDNNGNGNVGDNPNSNINNDIDSIESQCISLFGCSFLSSIPAGKDCHWKAMTGKDGCPQCPKLECDNACSVGERTERRCKTCECTEQGMQCTDRTTCLSNLCERYEGERDGAAVVVSCSCGGGAWNCTHEHEGSVVLLQGVRGTTSVVFRRLLSLWAVREGGVTVTVIEMLEELDGSLGSFIEINGTTTKRAPAAGDLVTSLTAFLSLTNGVTIQDLYIVPRSTFIVADDPVVAPPTSPIVQSTQNDGMIAVYVVLPVVFVLLASITVFFLVRKKKQDYSKMDPKTEQEFVELARRISNQFPELDQRTQDDFVALAKSVDKNKPLKL